MGTHHLHTSRCKSLHTSTNARFQSRGTCLRTHATPASSLSQAFRCRHFSIHQDGVTQKLGTDSMLLGAWADPTKATSSAPHTSMTRVLDIGTGSGVLALMMAQKMQQSGLSCRIDAIDVDLPSCQQARRNFESSDWGHHMHVAHCSLQELAPECSSRRARASASHEGSPESINGSCEGMLVPNSESASCTLLSQKQDPPNLISSDAAYTSAIYGAVAVHQGTSDKSNASSCLAGTSTDIYLEEFLPAHADDTTVGPASAVQSLYPPADAHWYDTIICNPPYFQDSTKPGFQPKAGARHADVSLSFQDLARCVASLLRPTVDQDTSTEAVHSSSGVTPSGFFVVLPTDAAAQFETVAEQHGLYLRAMLRVITRDTDTVEKRRLMKFELISPVGSHRQAANPAFSSDQGLAYSLSGLETRFPRGRETTDLISSNVNDCTLVVARETVCGQSGKRSAQYTQEYMDLTRDFHHPDYFSV